MRIQSTKITDAGDHYQVRILLADAPDEESAKHQVVIDLPIQIREFPILPELQKVVLQSARDAINREIDRLKHLQGRSDH